jgi:group II intron reverse transcriptase/maturase
MTQGELIPKKKKEMSSQERLHLIQGKLYQKAKREPGYKFYVLYDKVFVRYVLEEAYRLVRSRGGSPGIDGVTFEQMEREGKASYLEDLREALRTRTYRPEAVKRVWIPKEGGGYRPLGIPTIRDRIAQAACKLVIEPIFEADFEDSSHGYRPGRDAQGAIKAIKGHLQSGKTEIYDADLSKYFDTIPHDKLMATLQMRISDKRILQLIKMWLKAPVYEDGQYHGGKKKKEGIPQGGVISPLLANIYLHLLDRIVNKPDSLFSKLGISIVRYADDFILMGKQMPEVTVDRMVRILDRMGLRLNESKSKKLNAREEPFEFLGYVIRYDRSIYNKHSRFWHIKPSGGSMRKIRQNINMELKRIGHYRPEQVSKSLNRKLRGWLNYFDIKGVSYMKLPSRKLEWYLRHRMQRFYNRKSQRKSRLYREQAYEILTLHYGLINVCAYIR